MRSYFRWDLVHPPSDQPVVMYDEVIDDDCVRRIELFADGRGLCEAVTDYVGREHELVGVGSFVDGPYSNAIRGMPLGVACEPEHDGVTLTLVSQAEFEEVWDRHRS